MQKVIHFYLLAMSEYLSFGVGACAAAIMTTLLNAPHDAFFIFVGGMCIAAARAYVRQYRFGITPEEQVERMWLSLNEACLTELSIGSAALIFATALSGTSIVNTVILIAVLVVSLCNIWIARGTFDISVLQ